VEDCTAILVCVCVCVRQSDGGGEETKHSHAKLGAQPIGNCIYSILHLNKVLINKWFALKHIKHYNSLE